MKVVLLKLCEEILKSLDHFYMLILLKAKSTYALRYYFQENVLLTIAVGLISHLCLGGKGNPSISWQLSHSSAPSCYYTGLFLSHEDLCRL